MIDEEDLLQSSGHPRSLRRKSLASRCRNPSLQIAVGTWLVVGSTVVGADVGGINVGVAVGPQ